MVIEKPRQVAREERPKTRLVRVAGLIRDRPAARGQGIEQLSDSTDRASVRGMRYSFLPHLLEPFLAEGLFPFTQGTPPAAWFDPLTPG